MTWTAGYFCPKCKMRWVKHLCKDGKLPCGCGVSTEDAVFVYRKHYAKSGDEIYVSYKDFQLEHFIRNDENQLEALKNLLRRAERHPEEKLLKQAIANAISGKSAYERHWRARCARCKHHGNLFGSKFKCKRGNVPSIACADFE